MEVILKEDVPKLGSRGDVVKVAEGYGRNFLLPKKLAIEASQARGHNVQVACLPCAHYTTGQTPFKFLDAFLLCRFLLKHM